MILDPEDSSVNMHQPVMGILEEARIVSFSKVGDEIHIWEQCDCYYMAKLTLKELDTFIDELKALRNP